MKRIGLLIFLLSTMVVLQSHEFWLEPFKFKVKPGEAVTVRFAVGESFTGEDWNLSKHKVLRMTLHEKQGIQDLTAKVPTQKGVKQKITLANPGTKLIAMQSSPAFIQLNGKNFNAYLEEDGIENVIAWRKENNQDTVGAREFYSRYAKLLVQAGDQVDDTWKKVIGHKLEIVPLQNPSTLKAGDYLTVKILLEGNTLPHTMVKVWGHVGNKIFLQNTYTENDGTVKFPIGASGPWMVSTVRMEKSKDPKADWESSWASLVFSVEN
jgi:uncharacterized GH25 family protein